MNTGLGERIANLVTWSATRLAGINVRIWHCDANASDKDN